MLTLRARRGRASTSTRGARLRLMLAPLVAVLAVFAFAAPQASASATADISVAFSADFYSASISSTKGISHYDIVLCDGTVSRRELSFDTKHLTIGPFDAQIVSLTVKSATTKTTFYSGFAGDCKKKVPEPPKG
jgi:hypothetical protein